MVSPALKPQPPKSRINTDSAINESTKLKPDVGKQHENPRKLTLFSKYNALSIRVKLYIWISTAAVAWLADSVSDRIFEQNMIDAEANRRVEIELRKLKEAELEMEMENKRR